MNQPPRAKTTRRTVSARVNRRGLQRIISKTKRNEAASARVPWAQRWAALRGIWGVLLLVVVVLGGIYGGVFTATEGAGIGASGAFFFALARGALGW